MHRYAGRRGTRPGRGRQGALRRFAAAILFAMEQLSEQSGQLLRSAEADQLVRGRDSRVRRPQPDGAQGGPVRLQPVLPDAAHGQPVPTPYRYPAGYQVLRSQSDRGLHVPG